MKQRVNIQYSIDLEELPKEIENLLTRTEHKLSKCQKDIQSIIKNHDYDTLMTMACTKEISELREKLTDVDFVLEDVTTIVSSYIAYQLRKSSETSLDTPEALKQRMEDIKKELADGPLLDSETIPENDSGAPHNERLEEQIKNFKSATK